MSWKGTCQAVMDLQINPIQFNAPHQAWWFAFQWNLLFLFGDIFKLNLGLIFSLPSLQSTPEMTKKTDQLERSAVEDSQHVSLSPCWKTSGAQMREERSQCVWVQAIISQSNNNMCYSQLLQPELADQNTVKATSPLAFSPDCGVAIKAEDFRLWWVFMASEYWCKHIEPVAIYVILKVNIIYIQSDNKHTAQWLKPLTHYATFCFRTYR